MRISSFGVSGLLHSPWFYRPCLFSSITLEPQCTEPGRLLPDRLLGRLVFNHGFGTFTQLFLLLEERFSACALGSLICSQLALLLELALKGNIHQHAAAFSVPTNPVLPIPLFFSSIRLSTRFRQLCGLALD
jgi:hypothetical protein